VAEYAVKLKRSAEKELAKLPDDVLARMVKKPEKLATEPRPNGCEKLKGGSGEYRVRVGDYRALYVIDDVERLVSVTRVRHRREVYE
jgi:mRNA interferase RelE/StbE